MDSGHQIKLVVECSIGQLVQVTELILGQQVQVAGHRACVRYIGDADFAPGEWVGVELEPGGEGKRNGSGWEWEWEWKTNGLTMGFFNLLWAREDKIVYKHVLLDNYILTDSQRRVA